MPQTIRRLELPDIRACERVLWRLPHWFGIEASNTQYIRDLETMTGYVAEVEGEIVGFLAVNQQTPVSAELHIIAVDPGQHRHGIGRALTEAAEADLITSGTVLFQVKTLGPSDSDEGYANTRRFYEALGFLPLEETTAFWGPDNPTLVMVKVLR